MTDSDSEHSDTTAGGWTAPALRDWLAERVAELARLDSSEIDHDRPIDEYGLGSRDAVMISGELEDLLDVELPATLVWDHPTIGDLANRLAGPAAAAPSEPTAGFRGTPRDDREEPAEGREPIAVVGIGCRFPGGATDPDRFWQLLTAGHDAVTEVPPGRWDAFTAGATPDGVPRWGGFLEDVAGFDAGFFGISPREARLMDPQQRILLEVAWEALEHAGVAPASLRGSATGVFVGLSAQDYGHLTLADPDAAEAWTATGAAGSIAANRLSYLLDLRGPSLVVDTACSSSLVAVHQAMRSLEARESQVALAAGVNLLLSPSPTASFLQGGALSEDHRCKAFDASADGIVRGEGCGVLVLKRLRDAERDGDRVLALLRGSAVNSDGRSNGLTAPHALAQQDLLTTAYRAASVDPSTVDYVEAHGTGTVLGDPIEAGALGAVLGGRQRDDRPLLLGSVKTQLGHLESAAGIAGLIKVVLAMRNDVLPPGLHFTEPNPHIDFAGDRLRVVTEPTPWPRHGGRARAGVSGFGFGGTNAHVVVEEPAAPPARQPFEDDVTLVPLAARSADRLDRTAATLRDWCADRGTGVPLPDIGHTLALRRGTGEHRAAVVAADGPELVEALAAVAGYDADPAGATTGTATGADERPVFVFSGFGSQWTGMGAGLLARDEVFAAEIDALDHRFRDHSGFALREALASGREIGALDEIQMALFGVQVALARRWLAYGVRPAAVIGHSSGEVAAAVVCGALDVADGVRVITTRARLLAELNDHGGGAMAAVELTAAELEPLLAEFGSLEIAVFGAPGRHTVAGSAGDVRALVERVEAAGRTARMLPVRGAGHSPAVEPVLGTLRERLAAVHGAQPAIPWYSTVFDDPRRVPPFDAAYWAHHARRPVRFAQAVAAAGADGHRTFLEISPHPIAAGSVEETLRAADVDRPTIAVSLRRGQDERRCLLTGVGALHCAGVSLDWSAVHPHGRQADLPPTPWRHEEFWFRPARRAEGGHRTLGAHVVLPGGERHVWQRAAEGDPPTATELARAAACAVFPVDSADVRVHALDRSPGVTPEGRLTVSLTVRGPGSAEVDVHTDSGGDWTRIATAAVSVPTPAPAAGHPGVSTADGGAPAERSRDGIAGYLQDTVAGIMGFRRGELDPHRPLAELGLDSLMVTRIRNAVEHDLGVTLELSLVLRGADLAALTEHVEHLLGTRSATQATTPAAAPPAHTLHGGDGPALFLFPPAGGDAEAYRPLVAALGGHTRCVGFDRVAGTTLRERAGAYLERMRARQPHGPYRLGGWSFGGALAHQVACLLRAEGEEVSLVAMLDTVRPKPDTTDDLAASTAARFLRFARHAERTYGVTLRLRHDELVAFGPDEQIDLVVRRASEAGLDRMPGALRHQRESFVDTLTAERSEPEPFDGPVLLYRATLPSEPGATLEPRYDRPEPDAGWAALCPNLEVVTVDGDHLSIIDRPCVEVVAAHLRSALDTPAVAGAPR